MLLIFTLLYGPMIYTAPYVMCFMGANPLQRLLEGLGHESRDFHGQTLTAQVMDLPPSETLRTGLYQSEVHR